MQTVLIPRNQFELGCTFVRTHGRALDVELLAHALSGGNEPNVVRELARYQNSDGGFGHALAPGLRTPSSTGIATSVAIDYLRLIGLDDDHHMVKSAMSYLLTTVDTQRWVWPIITKDVDNAPHAPWWNYSENLAEEWNLFRFNPTADFIGFLYLHQSLVPKDVLKNVSSTFLQSLSDVPNPAIHLDIDCCARLYECGRLPDAIRRPLKQWLLNAVSKLGPNDDLVHYCGLVPSKDALTAELLRTDMARAAAKAIAKQDPDGSWAPSWDWSSVSQTEWQKAEMEWRGILTRDIVTWFHLNGMVQE